MPPEPTVDQLLAEAEEHLRQSEPLAGVEPRWVEACLLRGQHAATRAFVATVRRLAGNADLSAAGGGPEVPPKGDLLAQLDRIHERMTDEQRASFGLEAQGLCDDCRCYERGVAAGRREAAGAIRSEADDEARRPNRGGSSRLVERWLREAARLAEGDTDGT